MANKKLNIRLLKLNCYTTGETGDDEVYLVYNKSKIWPEKSKFKTMKTDSVELGVEIKEIDTGSIVEIELWDYDLLSRNDLLGSFKFQVDMKGGPFIAEMIKNPKETSIARYNLEWEIY